MWFITTTRIYTLWLLFETNSRTLTQSRVKTSRKWKGQASRKDLERKAKKQRLAEEKELKELEKKADTKRVVMVRGGRPDGDVANSV